MWEHLLSFAQGRNDPFQKSSLNDDQRLWKSGWGDYHHHHEDQQKSHFRFMLLQYRKRIHGVNAFVMQMANHAYWWRSLHRTLYSTGWEGGAVIWKIQPHEVHCVLNRTRGSVQTTVHILPAKNQVLALLKDSVASFDEKCLLRGLKILMPQRVPPYCHTASVLQQIMGRGSRGQGNKLRGCCFSLCKK